MIDIPAPTESQRAWMLAEQALMRVLAGRTRRSIPVRQDDDDIYLLAMIARGQQAEAVLAAAVFYAVAWDNRVVWQYPDPPLDRARYHLLAAVAALPEPERRRLLGLPERSETT